METHSNIAQELDTLLQRYYQPAAPGASIIVTRRDDVIYQRGLGMANLEHNIAVNPEMVFRIGSVTKQFTAVAILMLWEQGKLSLKDRITISFQAIRQRERISPLSTC